ncbi:hypothetical protein BHE74_00044991 [Ensete ventricosum]|nr:hypothetical protein GW17_00044744 [Ensete ventricosum]RWW48892.1 hypothetical protein BHE74_00044991 [Ensete ventricosum]
MPKVSGACRKLVEGIGGLAGVRQELTEGDRGLARISSGARRRSGACREFTGGFLAVLPPVGDDSIAQETVVPPRHQYYHYRPYFRGAFDGSTTST